MTTNEPFYDWMAHHELSEPWCFTGHRSSKLGGYNENNDTARWVKMALAIAIDLVMMQCKADSFISGMALATDQWGAEIVNELGKPLVMARPYPEMEEKWPSHAQRRYHEIIRRGKDNGGLLWDVHPGPYHISLLQRRNEWMADRARGVIAVWDGSSGGTANFIRYARYHHARTPIYRIDPALRMCGWMTH